jgi:hypothetical protein
MRVSAMSVSLDMTRAMPKSASLITPSRVSRIFAAEGIVKKKDKKKKPC